MKPLSIAALLAASLVSAPPLVSIPAARADVVELRSGERVEGTFKSADDNAVRIEVDGRLVTYPPHEVRAIYFGPAPAKVAPAPVPIVERDDAIGALGGLRSVAQRTVTYQEYAPRVNEVKGVVDRYLQKKEDGAPAVKFAIADSFHYYALAETAWKAGLSRGNYASVGADPALLRCAPAQEVIAESKRKSPFIWRAKGAGEGATTGMVIATDGLAALWSCASAKLAEAEKLRATR